MNGARDEILRRVRRRSDADVDRQTPPMNASPAGAGPSERSSPSMRAERFAEEAARAGATVHGPFAPEDAAAQVARLLQSWKARRVLAWLDPDPRWSGVPAVLAAAGCTLSLEPVPEDPEARRRHLAALDEVDVGVTGTIGALADTGTIVVASGVGRSRLAWLLPPVHVAIVDTSDVFPSMAAFFAERGAAVGDSAHLAFITGPSRTADIELTLTRGVHGPKELHLVLVTPSS